MKPLLFVVLVLGINPVLAQVAPEAAIESGGLQEIVVTAQKRQQNLQDVPVAVTAFSEAALINSGIMDVPGLQMRTPGLLVSTNGSYGQPYIRGIGSDIINPGTDAPVAVFEDGSYQSRPTAAISELFDVDRVEVLKGPQGTLYGRNATGGAINIFTRDPDRSYAADGDVIYGNYNRVTARMDANAPIGNDLAVRVAAMYTEHEGYTTNLFDGHKLDNQNLWSVRGKLKYAPSDTLSFVFTVEHTREHDSLNLQKVIDDPTLPLPVRDLAPLLGYAPPVIPSDPRTVREDSPTVGIIDETRLNAVLTWQLGSMEFKSISGLTKVDNDGVLDLDTTEINFTYDDETDYSTSVSQTFQLSSTGTGPFQWIAGVEGFHETGGQNFDARVPLFGPPPASPYGPDAAGFIWDSSITTNSASGFIDASYSITPKFTLNAGVRYTWEHKNARFLETIIDPIGFLTGPPGGTFAIPANPDATFKAWTPKFRLEYRPAEDVLLYASATRGFKSGGFNLMNTGEEFQPEKIWSYELGFKSTWLEKRLRMNAAAFYYDYKDLQVNQFSGLSNLVTNAANSHISGVEIETFAKPIEPLQLDLSAAYLDATYKDYFTHNAADPTGPELDLSGDRLPKAPRMTVIAGAEYSVPVAGYRLVGRGEARYQSLVFFDQFNTPQLVQGGYTVANARLTFEPGNSAWQLALFAQNLTDKLYRQSMVRVDNVFGTSVAYGAPRTYGIEGIVHLR